MSDKVKSALIWIKDILESQGVRYQIVGGFAAHIYGGSRPVADIDLYIPGSDIHKVLPSVTEFISKPLTHYVEHAWDLEYFQLIYQGQKIEIGLSPGTKIRAANSDNWLELKTDYGSSVIKIYHGIEVPVIPVQELVKYKQVLGREVDLIDIQELTGRSAP